MKKMDEIRKYGIPEQQLNQILEILKKNTKFNKVILFGSRAKGKYENGSDIDLTVAGNDIQLNDILNALAEIDNLELPYKVDIINYDRIHESALLEHIHRKGVVLFERKT